MIAFSAFAYAFVDGVENARSKFASVACTKK
jgi:hypothetical protein